MASFSPSESALADFPEPEVALAVATFDPLLDKKPLRGTFASSFPSDPKI
jgi:hypothetical protein